jgi:ubiquinone/menaquinone biosynthesis C-methylase UbiE
MATQRGWFVRYLDRREERRPDPVVREHRRALLAGLRGRVVEVGCGAGRNFEHYPPTVEHVLAVEPDDESRAQAEERAAVAPVLVEVVAGIAESLPAADATFDAAVMCWVLCAVSDQKTALREVRRTLKPGAELRVYEHVRSREPRFFAFQRVVEPVAQRLYGCSSTRDTEAALNSAGYATEGLERLVHSSSILTIPTAPHILGIARPRSRNPDA